MTENSVQDALDHDVPTKKMEVIVEIPAKAHDGDLESEVAALPGVKDTHGCNALCPVCDEPYDARMRLGFNHPVITDGADKLCMGEEDKTTGSPGGLGWLYSHGGVLTSEGI
jgi:hypothetical protein